MSTPKNDGGPAFPWSPDGPNYQTYPGMTLRDWFAGQALVGLASSGEGNTRIVANDAYAMADSMLKAREGKR